jgi:hypothetical protein
MSYGQYSQTLHGIDWAIDNLKTRLQSVLFDGFNYTAYGLAKLIEEENTVIPVIYSSGINYTRIFPITQGRDAISFFYQTGNSEKLSEPHIDEYQSKINLVFVVNATVVKSSITTRITTEDIINDIWRYVNSSLFEIVSVQRDLESINDFEIPEKQRRVMQPFSFIKFEMNLINKI